jgi:hypothetical protein
LPRPFRAVGLTAILACASACSPCFGVLDCAEGPHVAIDGQVVDGETGRAVPGVAITLSSRANPAFMSVASTDVSGLFAVKLFPATGGSYSLSVAAPGQLAYTIDSVPCRSVVVRGDACILPPIMQVPAAKTFVVPNFRGSSDVRVGAVNVHFIRTGGSAWVGPAASERFDAQSDPASSYTQLFPAGLHVSSLDPVVGDFIVDLPPPYGTSIHHGFLIYPTYVFGETPIQLVGVGPSLDYRFAFVDSATGKPLSGVSVGFDRTSGIATDPQSFSDTSRVDGAVRLQLRALATGTAQGTLSVRSLRAAGATTIPGFALPTFDTDSTVTAARWRVGTTGVLYLLPP